MVSLNVKYSLIRSSTRMITKSTATAPPGQAPPRSSRYQPSAFQTSSVRAATQALPSSAGRPWMPPPAPGSYHSPNLSGRGGIQIGDGRAETAITSMHQPQNVGSIFSPYTGRPTGNISFPVPEQYAQLQREGASDSLPSQPQRSPYTNPAHAVFLYWNRDLSCSVHLPRMPDGRNLFARNASDTTDHGWGPGVVVHPDVRAEVATVDRHHTQHVIQRDSGTQS